MSARLSRRRFLHTGAAVTVAGLWPSLRADEKANANDRLHVGVVGVAGQGAYNWGQLAALSDVEIVALCDVDEGRKDNGVQKARDRFPKATFHHDFRKMIDTKGLDAVLVATPDHTHAVITLEALRAGLHVYCEKPLTHTVREARLVAETAAKHKRVTQMGTQIHAGDNYRRVVERIRSGAIGAVKEVHVWVGVSYWGGDRSKETPAVPKALQYDLWLGPAQETAYHPSFVPYYWRRWWAFGGGALADMACHHIDLSFWALGLRHPKTVRVEGDPATAHPDSAAKTLTVHYEFPARGEQPPVKLTWYDGGARPALFAEKKLPKWGDGTLFVGEKGMLLAGYNKYVLLPEELGEAKVPEKFKIANSIGHHKEWVQACKNGGETTCNFDYSGALTEAVLLGNVAYRSGKSITWDAAKLKTGSEEADAFLHKEYRKGWKLE
jgi:predicted dehydrogenase